MRLWPPMIRQPLILCCPSLPPTFHVIGERRRFHVELCEDGLWIYVCGQQRGLYRVMESLFKTSRIELPSIWIPHYLLRKWQNGRMHCHVLVHLNSLIGVSQNNLKKKNQHQAINLYMFWNDPLNLRLPCLILPKSATTQNVGSQLVLCIKLERRGFLYSWNILQQP